MVCDSLLYKVMRLPKRFFPSKLSGLLLLFDIICLHLFWFGSYYFSNHMLFVTFAFKRYGKQNDNDLSIW